MSLSKSKCLYSNNCLQFLKCAVPLYLNGMVRFIRLTHMALFLQLMFQSVLGFMKRWLDTFNDQRQNSFMAIEKSYFSPIQIKGLIRVSPIVLQQYAALDQVYMTDGSTYTWHYRRCSAYFQDKELHTALFSQ